MYVGGSSDMVDSSYDGVELPEQLQWRGEICLQATDPQTVETWQLIVCG
jgi:hypothetical protein